MPTYLDRFIYAHQQLKDNHTRLYLWQKWLLPQPLKALLSSSSHLNHAEVYITYRKIWFFQRWCIPSLQESFRLMRMGLENEVFELLLAHTTLLSGTKAHENFNAAAVIAPWYLPDTLKAFVGTNLLSGKEAQANFDKILSHQNLADLSEALKALVGKNLFSGTNAQTNFDKILTHQNHKVLALTFKHVAGMYVSEEQAQANLDKIVAHQQLPYLANALRSLATNNLLSHAEAQTNFDTLADHQKIIKLAIAIQKLARANLLSGAAGQTNFAATAANPCPPQEIIVVLSENNLLSQEFFNKLIRHQSILNAPNTVSLWAEFPRLTEEQFKELINICVTYEEEPETGQRAIRVYLNRLRTLAGYQLNHDQSVHTASVHQSVSKSARRLKELYEEVHISEYTRLINELHHAIELNQTTLDLVRIRAAQNCINSFHNFHFYDVSSDLTLFKLLGLVWAATQDNTRYCEGVTFDKAISALVNGLYEMQRGYNLSAEGVDDGQHDAPICGSGIFNQLIATLYGIHQEIEINIINQIMANFRLEVVVKNCLLDYFASNDSFTFKGDTLTRKEYLHHLTQDMGEDTWRQIKNEVARIMWNEFSSLYTNQSNTQHFEELIESGQYVTLHEQQLNQLTVTNSSLSSFSMFQSRQVDEPNEPLHQPAGVTASL